jgi:hypothetical protein
VGVRAITSSSPAEVAAGGANPQGSAIFDLLNAQCRYFRVFGQTLIDGGQFASFDSIGQDGLLLLWMIAALSIEGSANS